MSSQSVSSFLVFLPILLGSIPVLLRSSTPPCRQFPSLRKALSPSPVVKSNSPTLLVVARVTWVVISHLPRPHLTPIASPSLRSTVNSVLPLHFYSFYFMLKIFWVHTWTMKVHQTLPPLINSPPFSSYPKNKNHKNHTHSKSRLLSFYCKTLTEPKPVLPLNSLVPPTTPRLVSPTHRPVSLQDHPPRWEEVTARFLRLLMVTPIHPHPSTLNSFKIRLPKRKDTSSSEP